MEKPPYRFEGVTHFSVEDVGKSGPRTSHVPKLNLEIGSRIPSGKCSLVLIEPFPPFGRPGLHLAKLKSLQGERIESIWVFPTGDDGQPPEDARIEITTAGGERAIFRCKQIKGLPDENNAVAQSRSRQILGHLERST